jgi:hypothetical protein
MPTGHLTAVARRRERGSGRGTDGSYPRSSQPIGRSCVVAAGRARAMLTRRLYGVGLRGWQLHLASLGSVGLCIGLWIRAKTVDQDERGNAERRALFVGLWPPMLWLIGDGVERHE